MALEETRPECRPRVLTPRYSVTSVSHLEINW
jgi:hypothetical protein